MRRCLPVVLWLCVPWAALAAQDNADVRRARAAYDGVDFGGAIVAARRALRAELSAADRAIAYEVLGYAYAALDSTRQAVDAFKELIFLAPDREPDVNVVSPRITSLYASALGQVLVVRHARVDSTAFVAAQGAARIHYEVSRPSQAITRVIGQGLDMVIDTQRVAGPALVEWRALTPDGRPVPAGTYQVVVRAVEGRNEFSVPVSVRVLHGAVDTLPHLTSLPGYTEQPETVRPPRDWRPLGISALIAGVAAGASLALGNSSLSGESRREIGGVSTLVVGIGLAMSIRKPDPQPVEANIRYNRLLREQLAQRNAEIAAQNDLRRRQVLLTVMAGGAP
jgi:hypothetical protein